jgi:hypothetical protein
MPGGLPGRPASWRDAGPAGLTDRPRARRCSGSAERANPERS